MDPNNDLQEPEILVELIDADGATSVEEFIKELEAKEKDLHIDANLEIEIEDSEFEGAEIPDFVREELASATPEPRQPVRSPQQPVRPPQPEQQTGLKTRVYELEREVEQLDNRLRELRTERNEIQEKSDRRLKDFENYKYRMDRERRGSFIEQICTITSQMLPVLDNLDRALDAAIEVPEKKRGEFKQFFDGMTLVNEQVKAVLNGMGVEPIKALNEPFDPNFHEAVATEERDDVPVNTILDELLRGYRIGNRVIRHSMVRVTTSTPGRAETKPVEKTPENEIEIHASESAPESDDPTRDENAEVDGDQ